MSVEQAGVIDGVGVQEDGMGVVLLISDHLAWDADHLPVLQSKLEAYVNAAMSVSLAKSYPQAAGKSVSIRIVWQYEPTPAARAFLDVARHQIGTVGFTLSDGPLPPAY